MPRGRVAVGGRDQRLCMIIYGKIEIRVLVRRGMAKLVSEEQIESLKAAPALLTLIRQKHLLGPDLNPLDLGVLAHVLFIRMHEPKPLPALRTGEASAPLSVDSLVMPQLPPGRQGLAATGTRVTLTRGMREHVGPESAHVPEQAPAARAEILLGVRAVVQPVQLGHQGSRALGRRLERLLGRGRAFLGSGLWRRLPRFPTIRARGRGCRIGSRQTAQRRHRVLYQRHRLLLLCRAGDAALSAATAAMGNEFGQDAKQLVTVQAAVKVRPRVGSHVAVELLQVVKDILADVARVRQRGPRTPAGRRVLAALYRSAPVVFSVAVMGERFLTARAVVALHGPVCQLVNAEEIGLTEGFATYVTFIRLLSRVDAHVSYEGRLKQECFTAILAHFVFPLFQ